MPNLKLISVWCDIQKIKIKFKWNDIYRGSRVKKISKYEKNLIHIVDII